MAQAYSLALCVQSLAHLLVGGTQVKQGLVWVWAEAGPLAALEAAAKCT